jgi:hypothetical protein
MNETVNTPGGENPASFKIEGLENTFDNFLTGLKETLAPKDDNEKGGLEISDLSISTDSINELKQGVSEAISAGFDNFIKALNENKDKEGGGDNSTIEGAISINHGKMTVGGQVDVVMPEDMQNLAQTIEDAINAKLAAVGIDPNKIAEARSGKEAPGSGGRSR